MKMTTCAQSARLTYLFARVLRLGVHLAHDELLLRILVLQVLHATRMDPVADALLRPVVALELIAGRVQALGPPERHKLQRNVLLEHVILAAEIVEQRATVRAQCLVVDANR